MAITGEWEAALKPEFGKPYYAKLYKTVIHEYRTHVIYPPSNDVFNAFNFTPLSVRIPTTGKDRPTACAFPCTKVSGYPRLWSTFTRS